jgi:hypothetical protein
MFFHRLASRVCIVGALATGVAGCDLMTVANAGLKLANGQIGALTADEIRVLSQTAADVINAQTGGTAAKGFTQEQAEAIVNFFDVNNVETMTDVQTVVVMAGQDPGAVQGLPELAAAFAGGEQEFDPQNVTEEDLDEIFSMVGGPESDA